MQSVTEFLLFYSLFLFYIHYLFNHSELLRKPREAVLPVLPKWLSYMLSCGFCMSTYISIICWYFFLLSYIYIFAAPVCVLFLNCLFEKLTENDK